MAQNVPGLAGRGYRLDHLSSGSLKAKQVTVDSGRVPIMGPHPYSLLHKEVQMKSNYDALKACVADSLEYASRRDLLSFEQLRDFKAYLRSCHDTAELAEFCRVLRATLDEGEKFIA